MDAISPEIRSEIERRIAAGSYGSADELLRHALKALDDARDTAREMLEQELLRGFEGDDVEMSASDWESLEREAVKVLESKKAS